MTLILLSILVTALFYVHPALGLISFVAGCVWYGIERQRLARWAARRIAVRRREIPAAVKQAVWDRDSGRCVLCGTDQQLQFDHVIPWSKGGADTVENLRLLCAKDNERKGARVGYA